MRARFLIAAVVALGTACEAPELPPSWQVRDLALSVAPEGGVLLAYARCCCDQDCDAPTDLEFSAVDPTVETEQAVRSPLHESSGSSGENPLFEGRSELVMGGGAGGGVHWFAFADASGAVHAVAASSSGGAPVEVDQHITSSALSRQLPNPSFGTMVRGGRVSVTASGELLVVGRRSEGGLAASVFSPDGAERPHPFDFADATVAATAGAHENPLFVSGGQAGTPPETTTVHLQGAPPLTARIPGLPAAVWTDGKAFRVVLKKKDSVATLWDGERSVDVPRSDEAACTAVAFDATGSLYMLHAGPRSSVLYGQGEDGSMEVKTALSVREEAGPQTRGCALSVEGTTAHVAWVEDGGVVAYEQWDLLSLTSVLKTRHETAKNSISNVR